MSTMIVDAENSFTMFLKPLTLNDAAKASLSFWFPGALVLDAHGAGSTTPTYTRASIATYIDATTGLVTEVASGVARFEANGVLIEGARTNICLYSDDFTNVAWTLSNMTAAYTSTGADGIASHASRLTATAGNATALQAITSSSAARVTSMWVKRITGTGNIDITHDNGTTWTTVTTSSAWAQVQNPTTTAANPTVGIRIVTSGDAIDVQYFDHENGAFASSAIPTTSAAVARVADSLTFPAGSNLPSAGSPGAAFIREDFIATNQSAGQAGICTFEPGNTQGFRMGLPISGTKIRYGTAGASATTLDGTSTISANVVYRTGISYASGNVRAYLNGNKENSNTTINVPTSHTRIAIGKFGDNGSPMYGHPSAVLCFVRALADTEMARLP